MDNVRQRSGAKAQEKCMQCEKTRVRSNEIPIDGTHEMGYCHFRRVMRPMFANDDDAVIFVVVTCMHILNCKWTCGETVCVHYVYYKRRFKPGDEPIHKNPFSNFRLNQTN